MITVANVKLSQLIIDSIRRGVQRATGIPLRNIFLSSNHACLGKVLCDINDNFVKSFVIRTIESSVTAWQCRAYGKLYTKPLKKFGLESCNRQIESEGTIQDPDITFIEIQDSYSKPTGVLFNYGTYPSALERHTIQFTED